MAYNHEYPYNGIPQLNEDWILNKIQEIETQIIGLDTFKYLGQNPVTDVNLLPSQSIASFIPGTAAINRPSSTAYGVVLTLGEGNQIQNIWFDISGHTLTRTFNGTSFSQWNDLYSTLDDELHTLQEMVIENEEDFIDLKNNIGYGTSISTSILEKAKSLKNIPGFYMFKLSGNSYSGNDLPNNNYCYGTAIIQVQSDQSITVTLFTPAGKEPIVKNNFITSWSGWETYVTLNTILPYQQYNINLNSNLSGSSTFYVYRNLSLIINVFNFIANEEILAGTVIGNTIPNIFSSDRIICYGIIYNNTGVYVRRTGVKLNTDGTVTLTSRMNLNDNMIAENPRVF